MVHLPHMMMHDQHGSSCHHTELHVPGTKQNAGSSWDSNRHVPACLCCMCAAIAALGAEPEAEPEPAAGISDASRSSRQDARVKPEAAAAAAGGGHVKHEAPGMKRERGAAAAAGTSGGNDEYVPRSATAADRIDLTEEVRGWWTVRCCYCLVLHVCLWVPVLSHAYLAACNKWWVFW
jgi:hypothetical protein